MKSCTTSAVKDAICLANSFLSSTALLCSATSDGSSCYWNQNGNRSFKHQNSRFIAMALFRDPPAKHTHWSLPTYHKGCVQSNMILQPCKPLMQ